MKEVFEVNDIIKFIENDEYTPILGIDEWDVHDYGNGAYDIEVNFEDRTQVRITLIKDEYFENRLQNFVQLVNNFWNK